MTAATADQELADLLREVAGVLAALRDGWGPKVELGQMATELTALGMHRRTILVMRRHLLRLKPWQWRRRRRIHYQLACIALALAEETNTQACTPPYNPRPPSS